jgi:hypothetical protein
MQKRTRLILTACGGGILGVLLVRALFLDPIEEIGWRMFWDGLFDGRLMNLGTVIQSVTFLKCLVGFILGGGAAVLLSRVLHRETSFEPQSKSKSTGAGM